MNLKSKHFDSICQGRCNSVQVNGDINFSLRKWKRNLKDSKIVEQLFANKFYKKPSDERREIMELAKYNEQKEG